MDYVMATAQTHAIMKHSARDVLEYLYTTAEDKPLMKQPDCVHRSIAISSAISVALVETHRVGRTTSKRVIKWPVFSTNGKLRLEYDIGRTMHAWIALRGFLAATTFSGTSLLGNNRDMLTDSAGAVLT